jgi:radical SAM protein with 4Fe4S-binding SPASM domain
MSFTGGEPTLRRDLPDLVARARAGRMRVNLITNGVRCASRHYVRTLAGAGLNSAQVSLEGPDAAVHDALTGKRGSFLRTRRGLSNLLEAGLTAHPHTTISRGNAAHLGAIVDLAAELGAPRLSMNLVIPTGTPGLASRAGLQIPYAEVGPLVLAARRRAEEAGLELLWYSPTPFCIWNPVAHGFGNKGCAACDGLIHVAPAGDVLPCSSYPKSVGNVLAEGFDAVWFGARATWHREKRHAPELCKGCEDFAACQGACPLYWAGRGLGELERACPAHRSRAAEVLR